MPEATRFRWGVALCPACAEHLTVGHLEVITRVLGNRIHMGEVTSMVGLHFWTPRTYSRPKAALLAQACLDLERGITSTDYDDIPD